MLVLVCSITKACGYGYSSIRYRTRWSPYVHGLVSGDIYYSPYAFRHGHSGLVRGDVRYSPYAFSYKHPSGLVVDYGYSSSVIYVTNRVSTQPVQSFEEQKKDSQEKMIVQQMRIEKQRQHRIAIGEDDGWWIILNFLKSKNVNFKIRNRLSIQNKTLCCEFLLGDGCLIKYRNPKAIEQAKTNPRYNRFYERYERDWTEFCKEHKSEICEIKSAS